MRRSWTIPHLHSFTSIVLFGGHWKHLKTTYPCTIMCIHIYIYYYYHYYYYYFFINIFITIIIYIYIYTHTYPPNWWKTLKTGKNLHVPKATWLMPRLLTGPAPTGPTFSEEFGKKTDNAQPEGQSQADEFLRFSRRYGKGFPLPPDRWMLESVIES